MGTQLGLAGILPDKKPRKKCKTRKPMDPALHAGRCTICGRYQRKDNPCASKHKFNAAADAESRQLNLVARSRRPRISLSELLGEDVPVEAPK